MVRIVKSKNYAAVRRYRERNKLFEKLNPGDLVYTSVIHPPGFIRARAVSKDELGNYYYCDKGLTWFEIQKLNNYENYYRKFTDKIIGLYLGRYDGGAIILIDSSIYRLPVESIRKYVVESGEENA